MKQARNRNHVFPNGFIMRLHNRRITAIQDEDENWCLLIENVHPDLGVSRRRKSTKSDVAITESVTRCRIQKTTLCIKLTTVSLSALVYGFHNFEREFPKPVVNKASI